MESDKQLEEKLLIYSKAQIIAFEEGDLKEVEKIEKKINKLVTKKYSYESSGKKRK